MVHDFDVFMLDVLIFTLVFLASTGIIYIIVTRDKRNKYTKAAVVIFVLITVFFYHTKKYDLFAEGWMLRQETNAIKHIKASKSFNDKRILAPGVLGKLNQVANFDNLEDLYYYHIDKLSPNVPMMYGISNVDGFDSLLIGSFARFTSNLRQLDQPWDNDTVSYNIQKPPPIIGLYTDKVKSPISKIDEKRIQIIKMGTVGSQPNPAFGNLFK